MGATQAEKAERFRALHERAGVFVIPNPWDAGTARVLASVTCYRGSQRAFQSETATYERLSVPDRKAVAAELEVAPNQLPPGLYGCQVNVIDDAAGTFAFPRLALYVR